MVVISWKSGSNLIIHNTHTKKKINTLNYNIYIPSVPIFIILHQGWPVGDVLNGIKEVSVLKNDILIINLLCNYCYELAYTYIQCIQYMVNLYLEVQVLY